MKKLLISLLALCLMASALAAAPGREVSPTPKPTAKAEQVIDLSKYEDETLVKLLDQVQQEIADRNIERTAQLQAGTYVFGQDLPVGKYVLKKEQNEQAGIVSLAAADDGEDVYPTKLYEFVGKDAYETYITGEEGDVLKTPCAFSLTISAGVTFQ